MNNINHPNLIISHIILFGFLLLLNEQRTKYYN